MIGFTLMLKGLLGQLFSNSFSDSVHEVFLIALGRMMSAEEVGYDCS